MAFLLGVVSILLVGCSNKLSKQDWSLISLYETKDEYLSLFPEVQYGPFVWEKKDANAIETYEELKNRFNGYKSEFEDFNENDFEAKQEDYFGSFSIITVGLLFSIDEWEHGVSIEDLYIENDTLVIPVSTLSAELSSMRPFNTRMVYFIEIKKSVLDKVDKVELDIINRYDNSRGSKYYQYK